MPNCHWPMPKRIKLNWIGHIYYIYLLVSLALAFHSHQLVPAPSRSARRPHHVQASGCIQKDNWTRHHHPSLQLLQPGMFYASCEVLFPQASRDEFQPSRKWKMRVAIRTKINSSRYFSLRSSSVFGKCEIHARVKDKRGFSCSLRKGTVKRAEKSVHLVLRFCCKASWIAALRNIATELVLQQCCKTSCTFLHVLL